MSFRVNFGDSADSAATHTDGRLAVTAGCKLCRTNVRVSLKKPKQGESEGDCGRGWDPGPPLCYEAVFR